jgi:protocatechuate 3,4-dioxygenase beta subunit
MAAGGGGGTGTGGGRGGVTTTQTVMVNGVPTTINMGTSMTMVRPRSVTTDAQGAFAFTGLPAGSYRLMASPGQYSAQYLGMNFGAKKPNGPMMGDMGQPIQLGNGQAFEKATIALPRGSVITGRVTDENGDPLARVQVYTLLYPPGNPRGMRTGGGDSTDDLGQFRIYGLTPGDYAIVAEARPNTFVQPNAPPESEEDKVGFMTSFYPGTPDEASAQRVPVRGGGETPGIEIRVVSGRLFRVSGMVTDSRGGAARVNGQLSRRTSGGMQSGFGFSTDEQGRFQMKNIPPGNYRLTVRQNPTGPRNPDGSMVDPGEFANVPLMVDGDLENLLFATTPGVTITGQIVFEHGPPQQQGTQPPPVVRVNAMLGDPMENSGMNPMPQPAVVSPELTFTMKGLMGEFLLRSSAPMQYLKSITVNGTDITDTPREFKQGEKVTITLSSRASTLEGNVTDVTGKPVTEAALILFSDDKASWRSNSIKTRRAVVDPNGHYRMMGLLPGRYFVIALPRERLSGMMDAAMFEELSKEATSLVVGDDEQRQVDLKMVTSPGGN